MRDFTAASRLRRLSAFCFSGSSFLTSRLPLGGWPAHSYAPKPSRPPMRRTPDARTPPAPLPAHGSDLPAGPGICSSIHSLARGPQPLPSFAPEMASASARTASYLSERAIDTGRRASASSAASWERPPRLIVVAPSRVEADHHVAREVERGERAQPIVLRDGLAQLHERELALVAGRVVGEVDRRDALVARDHVGDERDRGRGRARVAVAPQRARQVLVVGRRPPLAEQPEPVRREVEQRGAMRGRRARASPARATRASRRPRRGRARGDAGRSGSGRRARPAARPPTRRRASRSRASRATRARRGDAHMRDARVRTRDARDMRAPAAAAASPRRRG